MNRSFYAALVHYPVVDKQGTVVSTSVTNLDIHDISRSARTYGLDGYFLVTPVEAQHWLVSQVLEHWNTGWGSTYNENRKDALSIARTVNDIGHAISEIEKETGEAPIIVTTSAKRYPNSISYAALRQEFENDGPPVLIMFGTGWGLHSELMIESDYILDPIMGKGSFNHLSVRAAAAIIFDRLFSPDKNTTI